MSLLKRMTQIQRQTYASYAHRTSPLGVINSLWDNHEQNLDRELQSLARKTANSACTQAGHAPPSLEEETGLASLFQQLASALARDDDHRIGEARSQLAAELARQHPSEAAGSEPSRQDAVGSSQDAWPGEQNLEPVTVPATVPHAATGQSAPGIVRVECVNPPVPTEKKVVWRVPRHKRQLIPSFKGDLGPELFRGDPVSAQAVQGEINDCGYIAALRLAAAQHPEEVKAALTRAPDGRIVVRFHEAEAAAVVSDKIPTLYQATPTGWVIELSISAKLPFDEHSGAPLGAPIVDGHFWAPLFEKGFAAFDQGWAPEHFRLHETDNRGYARLNGTTEWEGAEILILLTGKRFDAVRAGGSQEIELLFREIADDRVRALVGTSMRGPNLLAHNYGVRLGHTYVAIGVENSEIVLEIPTATRIPAQFQS